MKKINFKEGKKYTFSDYFDFNYSTEDIAHEFGYSFYSKILELPRAKNINLDAIQKLQESFYQVLPKISLNSEMAKREFMIAPVLWEIIRHVDAKINVEYPIEINNKLGGSLDYLLHSQQDIIVIEAKKGDLEKGFNQLVSELIALDKYTESKKPDLIYGAVSIGELWRFGFLERKTKKIYRDLHSYRIPEDIEHIFLIMLGILL